MDWIKKFKLNSKKKNGIQIHWNWIQIQLKRNMMQIDVESIENLLIIHIIHDYGVERKAIMKRHKYEKTSFHST